MSITSLPEGAERLPPPTPRERHVTNELLRVPRAYTYPVIFDTKQMCLGTVVLLRKGERLFAFTAAHNIAEDMIIHVRLMAGSERRMFRVLASYIHPKYDPDPYSGVSKYDLAILELEPNPAVMAGSVDQLHTGEFRKLTKDEQDKQQIKSSFAWVVGFPTGLVTFENKIPVLRQTTFSTQLLDITADELTIYYPETTYQISPDGWSCEEERTTHTPEGYSGSGVWATGNPEGKLFDPYKHIKMLGIQTHWSPKTRLIRCVPSAVVIEALKEFKPDL